MKSLELKALKMNDNFPLIISLNGKVEWELDENISYFDICKLAVFDVLDFDDLINVLSIFLKNKLEQDDNDHIAKSKDLNFYGRSISEEISTKYTADT